MYKSILTGELLKIAITTLKINDIRLTSLMKLLDIFDKNIRQDSHDWNVYHRGSELTWS